MEVNIPTYEDRVKGCHVFSFSYSITDDKRETEFIVNNSKFHSLNRLDNDAIFSINEREDGKGMNVRIENVKVVPYSAFVLLDAPEWVKWLLSKFFKSC